MTKAYVVGARLPTGGAYMAYHVGRLLHLHFGYGLVDVAVQPADRFLFAYDVPMETLSVADMEAAITDDDVLIANPSFSSHMFGLRLKGRKIMYAQDFKTYALLDCHFDLRVAVSGLVQRFLSSVYGIEAPVIPAFIQLGRLPTVQPWQKRPKGSALVYMKEQGREHKLAFADVMQRLKKEAPSIDLSLVVEGRPFSHAEFLRAIGSVRYFVNWSMAEGFGLVALEAMALGTLVTGLDGMAGRDYMRPGENCLTGSMTDLRLLPGLLRQTFTDEALASACAAAGQQTAKRYGYAPFKEAWLTQLSQFLDRTPEHA